MLRDVPTNSVEFVLYIILISSVWHVW